MHIWSHCVLPHLTVSAGDKMIIYTIKATCFHSYIVAEGKLLHFRDMHLIELI